MGSRRLASLLILATISLQQVRGLTPLEAGIVFLAPALANAIGGVAAGRLGSRGTSPRLVMGGALALGAAGLAGLALLSAWPGYVPAFALASTAALAAVGRRTRRSAPATAA